MKNILRLALIAGSLVGCTSVQAKMHVLRCPATLPMKAALLPGSRLLGALERPGAELFSATLFNAAPSKISKDYWAEVFPDEDEETATQLKRLTWFSSVDMPSTLGCFYGTGPSPTPGKAVAMLLLPLPAKIEGECVFTQPKAARRGTKRRPPSTAVCTQVIRNDAS